ncbi:MAG: head decoration protein [Pseudomonadota bacterium]
MPTSFTEGQHRGEFLVSCAHGNRSFEQITLTGGDFAAGTVLGQVTADGKYTVIDPSASDGSETAVAVLYDNVDASSADQRATILARDAEVTRAELQWHAGATQNEIDAAVAELAAAGIIAR